MNNEKKVVERYLDLYPVARELCVLKTEGNDLKRALRILDILNEESTNVRTALDILEDSKAILMEVVEIC